MSIFLWYGYEGNILERAERVMEAGFKRASIWWEVEEGRSPLENLRLLRTMGLEIDLVHLPYYPGGLWSGDEEGYLNRHLKILEELHEGQISRAVFHPTSFGEEDAPVSEKGIYSFSEIFERSKELGIDLAGENLQGDQHLLALLENFDISLCLDTGHLGVSGNYPLLEDYFFRVSCLHLHDNFGNKDTHLIPGDGKLPLADWLDLLPKGLELHLEVNRGLSDIYSKMDEEEFLLRARRSLDLLGGRDE